MPMVGGAITSGFTPNARGLVALPNDVLLKILEALDVESAVTFHRVCKALYMFATSRPAWLAIARMVSQTGILPLPLHNTYPTPSSLSTAEMKAAIQRGIIAQRALDRSSPVLHVHSYLGTGSHLRPSSAYSLLSDQTVVHSAFLPGGRFLLTVQLDSSFACWDLESPTRTRSVRLQTGFDTVADDETVEPRCIAYWKTGGAYVEFAHDVVEEGNAVIVALLVIHAAPDQPTLVRNLHVLRIELPAPNSRRRPRPPIPDEYMYNMCLLASAPIPHPLFVCSSYVHASGHAGLIGAMSTGPEVIFVLFFNPRPPPRIAPTPPVSISAFVEAAAAVAALGNSRVTLIQCSFRTKPTRFYALGSAEHIILYCESGGCVYSYTHDVLPVRALAYTRSVMDPVLVIPAPAPHEDPFPGDEHGTPGAPHIQKMCVVLRKRGPAWLEYGDDWTEYKPNPGMHKISALSMTMDAETTNLDAFQGLVIGIHDVDANRKGVPRDDDMDVDVEMSATDNERPRHVPNPQAAASPSPPPSTLPPSTEILLSSQPPSTQPPRYRRQCRVRYKRTIFPSRLQCTWHELATLGSYGRRAVWIEGNGPPQDEGSLDVEPHDESATLRLMLSTVGSNNPKEVAIPPSVRAQLARVSCVSFEDSTGAIALATLDGQVMLLQFV
ncbi:unnamed protein product [Rhizoctonia solani]|uniref:F-box domain-containing protein n=1 Tax=Rhizoctonia solani TaxID=456999 RepID=A0A8H3AP98_9AGAM|nr:unnamed protein product [Rhizoctonia solani]